MAKQIKKATVVATQRNASSSEKLEMKPEDFNKVAVRSNLNKASVVLGDDYVSEAVVVASNIKKVIVLESNQKIRVDNYWGKPPSSTKNEAEVIHYLKNRRRYFPIDFFKLDQLFLASPTREVVLKVININDKSSVELEWLSYTGQTLAPSKNELYVVLPKEAYGNDNVFTVGGVEIDGMRYNVNAQIMCAVIGADRVVERNAETGIATDDSGVKYSIFVGTSSAIFTSSKTYDSLKTSLQSGGGAGGTVELP